MSIDHCSPTGVDNKDTDFGYTMSLIKSKYVMNIMFWLTEYKSVMRFNELKRSLGSISYKSLSSTLKQMEEQQLIVRTEYPQVPPKVEYSLTERGKSLIPILNMMCEWGHDNRI